MDFGFGDLGSVLGSLNQFTGQLASSAIAAAADEDLQEMVFEQQKELMEKQNNYNWEMMNWQRMNAEIDYARILRDTSPASQAYRYRQAGLSDAAAAMAAGDITAQMNQAQIAPGSAPSAPAAPYGAWRGLDLNFLGAMRQYEQLRQDKVAADIAEDTQESNTRGIYSVDQAKQVALDYAREALDNFIKSNPYSRRSLRYKAEQDETYAESMKIGLEEAKVNFEMVKSKFNWLGKMQQAEFEKMQQEITNLKQEEINLKKQGKVLDTQSALNVANTELAGEQKKLTEQNSIGKKLENILIQHGSPDSVAGRIGAMYDAGEITWDNFNSSLTGTKQYLHLGYDKFTPDKVTQDFYYYLFDEGSANASKLGGHTIGGMSELFDALPGVRMKK